jgi:hypothetical protein
MHAEASTVDEDRPSRQVLLGAVSPDLGTNASAGVQTR